MPSRDSHFGAPAPALDDAHVGLSQAMAPEALSIMEGLFTAAVGHRDWIGGTAPDSPTSSGSVPNPSIPGISSALAAEGTPPPRLDLVRLYGTVSDETAGSLAMVGEAVAAQFEELDREGEAFGERIDTTAAGRDPVRFALEQEAHIEEVRRRAAAKLGIPDEPSISVSQPHPPRALPPPRIAPPPASSSAPSVQGLLARCRSSSSPRLLL